MVKMIEAIKKYYKDNNKIFLFLTILFIIGVIAGTIFELTISDVDNKTVIEFLTEYVNSIKKGTFVFKDSFFSYITSSVLLFSIIWILGYSVIGIPIIFFFLFYKSFSLGFSVTSILSLYKAKGIIFALIYIFPHEVISLLLMMILIISSYKISISIINAIIKKKEISFKEISKKYLILLLVIITLIIIISLYKAYLLPKFVKMVLLKV